MSQHYKNIPRFVSQVHNIVHLFSGTRCIFHSLPDARMNCYSLAPFLARYRSLSLPGLVCLHRWFKAAYVDYCARWSRCLSVSLSRGRIVQNGWTDRRPVWSGDFWGPKKHCIRWAPLPHGEGKGFDAAFAKLLWPLVLVPSARLS